MKCSCSIRPLPAPMYSIVGWMPFLSQIVFQNLVSICLLQWPDLDMYNFPHCSIYLSLVLSHPFLTAVRWSLSLYDWWFPRLSRHLGLGSRTTSKLVDLPGVLANLKLNNLITPELTDLQSILTILELGCLMIPWLDDFLGFLAPLSREVTPLQAFLRVLSGVILMHVQVYMFSYLEFIFWGWEHFLFTVMCDIHISIFWHFSHCS